MMQYQSLRGKKVVIIGGTSGLGMATAQMALSEGAQVHIGGSCQDKLSEALTMLRGDVTGDVLDIMNEDSVIRFFATLTDIEHLVVTAARIVSAPIVTGKLSELHVNMNSRFWGAVYAIRSAVPRMTTEGSITLTSGMITQRPQATKSIAAAAASAVEMLTHSLVSELSPRRINTINPGPMNTPFLERSLGNSSEVLHQVAQKQPLKRIGQPENYARSVLFAMINKDLNGEILHLNGGAAWV